MLSLGRLEAFLTIVELGTVTAAAERLHIAQPALSRQLSALEHEVGFALFTRERGRLQLTRAGALFATLARDLLDHANRLGEATAALSSGQPVRLVIAAPLSTLNEVLAPFVAELGADDPLVTAFDHPALRPPDESLGRADIVICAGPAATSLDSRVLGDVPVCVQVHPSHRFARDGIPRLDVGELVDEPLILQSRENMSRVILESTLAGRGLTAQVTVDSEVELMAQAIAASGRGVAVLTERPRFGLHAIHLYDGDTPLRLTLHATWVRGHYAERTIVALAERLRDYLAEVVRIWHSPRSAN
ncbi:MAG: LysR family transcriptional regulator [Dermatophilaceae bacterium]|nr:LysR family transcriptional regulator [Dermatophilaceae bacterium]MBP9918867.1 LysR family transcriptional regulator [Dermatophilaceae bacterium]